MFDLTGKKALITGGSGGIGAAMVEALAAHGAEVCFSGRNQEKLKQVAENIKGKHSDALLHTAVCDLSQLDQVEGLADQAKDLMGGIDILINNAGMNKDGLFMRMKLEDFEEVIKVNLLSNFVLTKKVLLGMCSKRWGRIISVTSVVSQIGNAGQANYAASKAGVNAMCQSLARETGAFGVTVNCIAPGLTDTAMANAIPEAAMKHILDRTVFGRLGKVEEIASAAVFLSSDESAYMTGTTININGGLYMT